MKKSCLAWGLAALMCLGPMAYGEEIETAPAETAVGNLISMESLPSLPVDMSEGLAFYDFGTSKGCLSSLHLPKKTSLYIGPAPVETLADASGILFMEGKKYDSAAAVFGLEFTGEEAEKTFGGMFLPGGFSQEAAEKMLHFNMSLLQAGSTCNEFFLTVAKGTRAATGELLPYDFLALDMVRVEQLHRVTSVPKTYSFAVEPYLSADGFALPLYARGFAMKSETGYRFLLFVTLQSMKEELDRVTYQIIQK